MIESTKDTQILTNIAQTFFFKGFGRCGQHVSKMSLICSQDVLKMPSTHHKNLKDVPQISKKGFQDSSRGCQVCLQMYHKCPQNIPSYQKDVSGCPQAVSKMSKDVPKMFVILHTKSYFISKQGNDNAFCKIAAATLPFLQQVHRS